MKHSPVPIILLQMYFAFVPSCFHGILCGNRIACSLRRKGELDVHVYDSSFGILFRGGWIGSGCSGLLS